MTQSDLSTLLAVLIEQLRQGKATMATVARELGLSEATLRRRLVAQKRSFSQLLDQARYALAQRYLADPTLELCDITDLMGFDDEEQLEATFVRWSGVSPQAYRQARASGAPSVSLDAHAQAETAGNPPPLQDQPCTSAPELGCSRDFERPRPPRQTRESCA